MKSQYGIGSRRWRCVDVLFYHDRTNTFRTLGQFRSTTCFSENFTLLNLDEEITSSKGPDRWAIGVRGGIIVNAAVNLHRWSWRIFLTLWSGMI